MSTAGCRFEYAINAPVIHAAHLAGDWQGRSGRYIIRDLRDGRVRILAKFANGGMILDGHIVRFENENFLQTQVLARIDPEKNLLPMPNSRWLIFRLDHQDRQLTLEALKPIHDPVGTYDSFTDAVRIALKTGQAFGKIQQLKWVGSDEPAKL
jgi:hypothetical protein